MSEISPPGKPWTNDSVHNTYELADKQRQTLLEKWDIEGQEGMQVKVKYRFNRDIYSVKTRLHPNFEPPKTKKKSKKKPKKKNTDE
jgi:hypothetical protein